MFNESEISESTESSAGPSRRQVVRVGANLAWAVPAISIATAAPSLAASGRARLTISSFRASSNSTKVTLMMGAVSNSGPGTSGVPSASFELSPAPKGITSVRGSGGWKQVGGSKGMKFTSAKGELDAHEKTAPLTVVVTFKKAKKKGKAVVPHGNATVTVVASNASPASTSDADSF